MVSVSDLLLGVLVLAVGWFLARRGRPLVRALVFASALVVSALLFLPGSQILAFVGADGIVKLADVERIAEGIFGKCSQLSNLQFAGLVCERLAGPTDVAIHLLLHARQP